MSFEALAWAAKQKPGNMAAKMVLLALANYANEDGEAYPSVAAISAFGEMNHKTVGVALARLEAAGIISDTGLRRGTTRQVKVYRLVLQRSYDAWEPLPGQYYYVYRLSNPATGEFYFGKRSSGVVPEKDRYLGSGVWPREMVKAKVKLDKEILATFDTPRDCADAERALIEGSAHDPLCRNIEFNTPKNGVVNLGVFNPKTPVFSNKDTQKRVTDTIKEPLEDDKSSSYTPSRKDDPFPKPDWADAQVWDDFLKNRKAKKLPNTATAYSRLMADLNRLADAEWPPGRLLEHAAAKGWGGIYDPRGKDNGTANRTSTKPPAATDGFAASLRYVANQTDHDGWHQERCGLPEIDALGGEFH